MFSRVFTLYALFALFACMLMCASASPLALPESQAVELNARGCGPYGGCKLAEADESDAPDVVAETPAAPEATGEPVVAVEPTPIVDTAQTSGASLVLPSSFGPAALLGALASATIILL